MTKTAKSALRITLLYAVFAAVWIRFSDIALEATVTDVTILTQMQTIKGWLFVVVTAVLLFGVILRGMNTIDQGNRLDRLTGLLNHDMFKHELDRKLSAREPDQYLVVIYLDIDGFSLLNRKLGFEAADKLLLNFSRELRQNYSASVILGRFPPDQFGVAFLTSESQESLERGVMELKQLFIRVMHQNQLDVTCCLGVATGPGDGKRAKALMSAVVEALQKAKHEGADGVQFFNRELSEIKNKRMELLRDLRTALDERSLSLVYQPQYSLKDNSICGVEVLIRWQHSKHGFVPPDRFIPLAEEFSLCDEISAFVIERADQELREQDLLGKLIPRVSINISAIEFNSPQLMDKLIINIENTLRLKHHLQIEITETATLNNIEKSAHIIRSLNTRGIKFAVDDFGTGYTSLAMLKDLPINEIKIDRFFVNDLDEDGKAHTIIEAIIAMSESFGVNTVAEGIETPEQMKLLGRMGCSEAQGYYLAVPMNIHKLKQHLSKPLALKTD